MLEKPCEGVSSKTLLNFSNKNQSNERRGSIWSGLLTSVRGIINTLFYGNFSFLEETEEKLFEGVESPFYRFFVDVDDNVNIFTISSIPYDVLKLWTKSELDSTLISKHKLDKPVILFIHGFTAGSCFWVNNLDSLYNIGYAIFCIDLPGFGHSSRCEFPSDSLETEYYFVNFIKLWQDTLSIPKVILIGHSMGGYLTYSYAIRNPEKLDQIILVDAWGFPDIKRKVTETLSYDSSEIINQSITRGGVIRFVSYLLAPLSPFSFLRILGKRLGPKFVGMYRPDLCQRYENLYGSNSIIFNNYVYAINSLYPSGETAFRNMAQVFGWAKNPMILRSKLIGEQISISFIYGARSWVSSECGLQIKNELTNKVRVYIIPDSGHHVYCDHPRIFNYILKALILKVDEADLLENEVCLATTAESCFPIVENYEKILENSSSRE